MDRLSKSINCFFKATFFAIFSSVLFLLLFCSGAVYNRKVEFLLPNYLLIIIALCVFFGAFLILKRYYRQIEEFLSRFGGYIIIGLTLVFVFTQIYFCYCYYFLTGWDVAEIIDNAQFLAKEEYSNVDSYYFSVYPNNMALGYLYAFIFKIGLFFGVDSPENRVFLVVILQIIISAIVSYLTYSFVLKFSKSHTLALSAWLFYILFVGLSPWKVIPYSDSTGLLFPMLILWVYQAKTKKKHLWAKYFLIGLLSFVGYKIKPQIVFVLIAVAIAEGVKLAKPQEVKTNLKETAVKCLSVVLAFVCGISCFNYFFITKSKLDLNKELEMGMTHFLMMGLNPEGMGVYNGEDVQFSISQYPAEKRKEANLKEVKNRLEKMGVIGTLKLFARKNLTNYNDGTFAWSLEGGFYTTTFEDKNETISPLLKNVYYSDGRYYPLYSTAMQFMWLMLIVGLLGTLLKGRYNLFDNKETLVLLLCLIGLTVFETVFEARARYLFIYSPFYLIGGMMGLINIFDFCHKWRQRKNTIVKTEKE